MKRQIMLEVEFASKIVSKMKTTGSKERSGIAGV